MIFFNGRSAAGGGTGERPMRSLLKAISWRVTGSIDTLLLSWFFTGDLGIAAAIGLTEVCTKMLLYYLHERAWSRLTFGHPGLCPATTATPVRVAEASSLGHRALG
jgi:uncharacterized membrane protein